MGELVDLHIHSDRSSDGDVAPAEIVRMAAAAGFAALSVSDHDTTAAYPEALEAAAGLDVEVVPSMEVTTLYEGREFHVLLPFLDWGGPVVARVAARVSEGRWIEAKERVAKLRELGMDLTWEEIEAASGAVPPLGVTIAQYLLDKPESRRDPALRAYYDDGSGKPLAPYHFYRDFFMEGRPAFVPKRHMSLLEVLDLAPAAGAVPVLSHPGAYFQNTTPADLTALKARGLQGVEVYTSYHDAAQVELYAGAARALDLVPTAGSDFHGRIKPHVAFGSIKEGRPWMVEELRRRRP